MGMSIEAMKRELAAMNERMKVLMKEKGDSMEKSLTLHDESIEDVKVPLVQRIFKSMCKTTLHIGAEILGVGAVAVFLVVGVCMSIGMLLLTYRIYAPFFTPGSPQEIFITIVLSAVILFTFWRETRRFENVLKGWVSEVHCRIG